ncbi:MAG: glycosyltransferase family 2 protein [Lachnospiraceae bacterium]|nr:glycosyltransferase family 2 protein [Lachnospiraceae bacterium]
MMNIVFVVLHYENLRDTKACVESLLKYVINDKARIVIVDNGSIYGKLDEIKKIYYEYDQIYFLKSEKNLGFAKGNNLGFLYAKHKLKAEIIILCNNDLIFPQIDYIKIIKKHFEEDYFDVAGNQIISIVDGKNQNPIPVQYATKQQLFVRIIKYYILYFFCFFNFDIMIQKFFSHEIIEYHPNKDDDFQLFGACLIFANRYIKEFDGLYDKTFMYNEESILKERVKNHKLKMKYYEDAFVKHKEGASTKEIYGEGKKKRKFYYKWNIDSCWKLWRIKTGKEEV